MYILNTIVLEVFQEECKNLDKMSWNMGELGIRRPTRVFALVARGGLVGGRSLHTIRLFGEVGRAQFEDRKARDAREGSVSSKRVGGGRVEQKWLTDERCYSRSRCDSWLVNSLPSIYFAAIRSQRWLNL